MPRDAAVWVAKSLEPGVPGAAGEAGGRRDLRGWETRQVSFFTPYFKFYLFTCLLRGVFVAVFRRECFPEQLSIHSEIERPQGFPATPPATATSLPRRGAFVTAQPPARTRHPEARSSREASLGVVPELRRGQKVDATRPRSRCHRAAQAPETRGLCHPPPVPPRAVHASPSPAPHSQRHAARGPFTPASFPGDMRLPFRRVLWRPESSFAFIAG